MLRWGCVAECAKPGSFTQETVVWVMFETKNQCLAFSFQCYVAFRLHLLNDYGHLGGNSTHTHTMDTRLQDKDNLAPIHTSTAQQPSLSIANEQLYWKQLEIWSTFNCWQRAKLYSFTFIHFRLSDTLQLWGVWERKEAPWGIQVSAGGI